jgi:hypothetical protein
VVYDNQTRSVLETDQKSGGLDSNNPSVKANADGSYTIWFGPKAPERLQHEGNWIQTMPGKGYNMVCCASTARWRPCRTLLGSTRPGCPAISKAARILSDHSE